MKSYFIFLLPVSIITFDYYDSLKKENLKIVEKKVELKKEPIESKKLISVSDKKATFKKLIVPSTLKVYNELLDRYNFIKISIENKTNQEDIDRLKKEYKVSTDKELLKALKPHPVSIVLAQAAIESGWGTSRFFKEANNVFGIWSFNKNEPRILAGKTRGNKQIWLKKYASIEDSIRDNYKNLGRSPFFKEFREIRFKSSNPHELVTKLDRYSEKGDEYGKILSSLIKYNNFEEFDN